MIKQLINLATHLDKRGFTKEADYLDALCKRAGSNVDNALAFIAQKVKENDGNFYQAPERRFQEIVYNKEEERMAFGLFDWGGFQSNGFRNGSDELPIAKIIVDRANKEFGTNLKVGFFPRTPGLGLFSGEDPSPMVVLKPGPDLDRAIKQTLEDSWALPGNEPGRSHALGTEEGP